MIPTLPPQIQLLLRALLTEPGMAALCRALAAARGRLIVALGLRPEGIYEVLAHHTTLELLDPQGRVALVERRQTVRFLQDYVEAISDHAWGDGELFAEYSCFPGVPVDRYQDGSRHTMLISLRRTMSRGDLLDFQVRRKIVGGFTQPEECWETDVYHPTQELSVTVIFPRERRCQWATVTQRSSGKTVALGRDRMAFLEDGRQRLVWELPAARRDERYALKWRW